MNTKFYCVLTLNVYGYGLQWSMRLEGEEVKVVALGTAWVAAITSSNFLRIFTEGGLQVCQINIIYILLDPFFLFLALPNGLGVGAGEFKIVRSSTS